MLSRPTRLKSQDFGRRLRETRKRRGWDIIDTAERCGMSPTTLKLLEKGDPSVGWGFYLAVLELFGIISELDGLCHAHRDIRHQLGKGPRFDADL